MIATALRYLIVATLLSGVAVVLLAAGRLDRRLAAADRAVATLDLTEAERAYAEIADSLTLTEQLPWVLRGTRETLAARRAALQYWRGNYETLVAAYTRPDSPSMANNIDLQFVVANADYRSAQQPGANRELALGTIDHAIGVYRRLLEGNAAYRDAAFNYELMVRLRTQIASGDEVPNFRRPTIPGNPGEAPPEEDMEDVQIYVPRDSVIDPDDTEDPTVGEGAPIRRRG